ncbi:hypothetical protein ACJRO7_027135 [Eucalyptus globulus]|uniref:Uncharacterized protein n=1 Tax=Eucalyptus globulus TaxID=34317 RepID=A0ABD3JSU7_EUCGL
MKGPTFTPSFWQNDPTGGICPPRRGRDREKEKREETTITRPKDDIAKAMELPQEGEQSVEEFCEEDKREGLIKDRRGIHQELWSNFSIMGQISPDKVALA